MSDTREKLIEVKRILGMCVKQGILSECKGCPYNKSNSSCVDALMEDALAVINHLERKDSVQKWIPVSERLPDENVRVLVLFRFTDYSRIEMDTDRIEKGKWYRWSKYVTHWMPLPDPPKGE